MDKGTLIGIVGLTLAVCSFLFSHFKSKTVADLESDVRVLQKQMTLFWAIAEKGLGAVLHSPHRAELDGLIEKIDRREQLSQKELDRFDFLMNELICTKPSQMTPGEEAAMVLYHAAVMSRHLAARL